METCFLSTNSCTKTAEILPFNNVSEFLVTQEESFVNVSLKELGFDSRYHVKFLRIPSLLSHFCILEFSISLWKSQFNLQLIWRLTVL